MDILSRSQLLFWVMTLQMLIMLLKNNYLNNYMNTSELGTVWERECVMEPELGLKPVIHLESKNNNKNKLRY